jgi:hypothetical protein
VRAGLVAGEGIVSVVNTITSEGVVGIVGVVGSHGDRSVSEYRR